MIKRCECCGAPLPEAAGQCMYCGTAMHQAAYTPRHSRQENAPAVPATQQNEQISGGVDVDRLSAVVLVVIAAITLWAILQVERTGQNVIFVLFCMVIAIMVAMLIVRAGACPECRRAFAMKEISSHLIDEYRTTVDVQRTVKNGKGEVIRRYTEAVPATKCVYDCVDECRYCKYQRNVTRQQILQD